MTIEKTRVLEHFLTVLIMQGLAPGSW